MIFGKLLNKEGKVEQYEKREALANVIPFRPKRGLEDLQLIDISRPIKKERMVCKPVSALTHNNPITG